MKKILSIYILFAFVANIFGLLPLAQSGALTSLGTGGFRLLTPGAMVHLSPKFTPAQLKGIVIHPQNPLMFDFIILRGRRVLTAGEKREEYTRLIKYFLASLAIPDENQWVNLSPYEKDHIISEDFGKTLMGHDLLSQDYTLKQITASLIFPEDNLGKKFWDRVYSKAQQQYGTTNIQVNTFNKVWIIPDDALIYEKSNTAYVLRNHLRVMLEEDYLALQKQLSLTPSNTLGSQIVREIILPALEKEVNEGKNFAVLRQVYSGMLLATWFKRTLKKSILGQIYADKGKLKGVNQNPKNNEAIYERYVKAYKKGVFNYIKEDWDGYAHQPIPRKYFAGGTGNYAMSAVYLHKDPLRVISLPSVKDAGQMGGEMSQEDSAQVVMTQALKRGGRGENADTAMASIFRSNNVPMLLTLAARISGNSLEEIYKIYHRFFDRISYGPASAILSIGFALGQRLEGKTDNDKSFIKAMLQLNYKQAVERLNEHFRPLPFDKQPSSDEVSQIAAWLSVAGAVNKRKSTEEDVFSTYKRFEQMPKIQEHPESGRLFSRFQSALLTVAQYLSQTEDKNIITAVVRHTDSGREVYIKEVMMVLMLSLIGLNVDKFEFSWKFVVSIIKERHWTYLMDMVDVWLLAATALYSVKSQIPAVEMPGMQYGQALEEWAVGNIRFNLDSYQKLSNLFKDKRILYNEIAAYIDAKVRAGEGGSEEGVFFDEVEGRGPIGERGLSIVIAGRLLVVKKIRPTPAGEVKDYYFYVVRPGERNLQYIFKPSGILVNGASSKYMEASTDEDYFQAYLAMIRGARTLGKPDSAMAKRETHAKVVDMVRTCLLYYMKPGQTFDVDDVVRALNAGVVVRIGLIDGKRQRLVSPERVMSALQSLIGERLVTPLLFFNEWQFLGKGPLRPLSDSAMAGRQSSHAAMVRGVEEIQNPGGIDMNSAHLAMRIKRDGKGVVLPLEKQDLAQLSNIEGLDPVILSIKPAAQTSLFSQLLAS